jgi:FtsP/CotA-like multicopper oxidase with cupredoxin domain
MAKGDEVKVQNRDNNEAAPPTIEEKARAARRKFLRQALVVTSGIALSELLPSSLLEAAPQVTCTPGSVLIPINQIKSNGNKLQAVMKIVNGTRVVPLSTGNVSTMLRYYQGYNPADPTQKWPPDNSTAPGPGPTLVCKIGDDVQITFLNQVNVADFPGSLASGDYKTENGCDQSTKINPDGTPNKNWYPANDVYPNCLHASSAANIHFHGTHVTPSTTGDNVLINVWPNTKVKEEDVQRAFKEIFQQGDAGRIPQKWADLPLGWRTYQERLIKQYDTTAPYVGPGANPNGHGLPERLQLWPHDQAAIDQGVWPQYYVGSYPYSFKIPVYKEGTDGKPLGVKMGQAPGTHWYHSHKHGSTTINMLNGLSGALIIQDTSDRGYDGALNAFYAKSGKQLQQVVLVFQQITGTPNLFSAQPFAGRQTPALLVNGQATPTIEMKPGEVQLWRMVNASVSAFITAGFQPCSTTSGITPGAFTYKQTAQDGVQLSYTNYKKQALTQTNPINNMAPANRIDLLVKAPTTPGNYKLGGILYVTVKTGADQAMGFPETESEYPEFPKFLRDIPDTPDNPEHAIRIRRKVFYGWQPAITDPPTPGRNQTTGVAPKYTIDGKQFEDNIINQVMELDTTEEWTIYNATTGIAHPFHIHVNPFQIVEVYDPTGFYNGGTPMHAVFDSGFVWWDTFGIPPGKYDATTKKTDPGYFRMRTRFVDFTGQYVQHCHILAHEDRGMMQLLEVVTNKTILKHH